MPGKTSLLLQGQRSSDRHLSQNKPLTNYLLLPTMASGIARSDTKGGAMHKGLVLTASALISMIATDAVALTRIDLEGSVYYASGDAVPVFPMGTKATAWFEYNENASGRAWYPGGVLDPSVFFYQNAPTAGGMTVGDYSVTFSEAARMFVTNQEQASYGLIDRVLFDDHDPIGGALNGRLVDAVGISWQDNTASALDSLVLPSSQQTFTKFGSVRSSIDWTPYIGAAHRVSISWNSVTVAAVPEPATWMMMIGGFGAVGGAMRRRSRATKKSTMIA